MCETEQKRGYTKRDWSEYVGQKFGKLTIVEICRRTTDRRGKLNPPKCRCQCDCGKEYVALLSNVVYGSTRSCGCLRSTSAKNRVKRSQEEDDLLIKSFRYYCPYPTDYCSRSFQKHICCHYCENFGHCTVQCDTTVERCGAEKREVIESV